MSQRLVDPYIGRTVQWLAVGFSVGAWSALPNPIHCTGIRGNLVNAYLGVGYGPNILPHVLHGSVELEWVVTWHKPTARVAPPVSHKDPPFQKTPNWFAWRKAVPSRALSFPIAQGVDTAILSIHLFWFTGNRTLRLVQFFEKLCLLKSIAQRIL